MLMDTPKFDIPPDFDSAPKAQRIAFVQDLWDRIARDPSSVPFPEHHRRLLDERLGDYRSNPTAGRPWSEVRERLLAKLRES